MTTPGKNPNREDLSRAMGWDVKDKSTLKTFLQKHSHMNRYIHFYKEWMVRSVKGVGGPNEETIVEGAEKAIRNNQEKFVLLTDAWQRVEWGELEFHIWFVVQFWQAERLPTGVWGGTTKRHLPKLLSVANLFLRNMKCTGYYKQPKQKFKKLLEKTLEPESVQDEEDKQVEEDEDEHVEEPSPHDTIFLYGEGPILFRTFDKVYSMTSGICGQKNLEAQGEDLKAATPSAD